MEHEKRLVKTALFSRLLLVLIQFASNLVIPDHDAHVFTSQKLQNASRADNITDFFLGGFLRWDAHYFNHIALYGYTYENTLAFFPLFPLLSKATALILDNFISFLNFDSILLLVFLGINITFFVLSALTLYKLSEILFEKNFAFKASLLFCINPASVFFTAPYTECIFSYLSFKSMLNVVQMYKRGNFSVVGIIPIALSTLARSNGLLNVGFLMYCLICVAKRNFKHVFKILVLVPISVLPFIAFQVYSYSQFCTDFEYELSPELDKQTYVLPGSFSKHNQSWCHSKLPLAYSYVQSHYWNVGFLEYYKLKQIPNFLLAVPIVFLVTKGVFTFFKSFRFTGFWDLFNFDLLNSKKKKEGIFNKPYLVVFMIHATFLTVFCVLNVHIQVTTRMLCSATPVVFWFATSYFNGIARDIDLFKRSRSMEETLILAYFLSYFAVGTVMFCNFLPWT